MTREIQPRALRDYAMIADGERGVLVGPHGEHAWMCFPAWDSPPLFGGLLGGPGGYVVRPAAGRWVRGGYYEDRGLIWHSRWVTGDGAIVESREALARPARRDRAVVLRRCRAVRGAAALRVLLDVRGPGGAPMRDLRRDGPVWTARAGDARIRWRGADDAAVRTGDDGVPVLTATVDLAEDETRDLVLEIAARAAPGGDLDPDALWDATERDWLAAVPSCEDTIAPRDARLAYGVLTGLTSRAGGMVAAATTGLPERADKGRNFDYRYAWIRDQCFAGLATAVHGGPPDLLRGAVAFVTDRVLDDRDALRPAYTVSGAIMPDEHGLDLPGYPGAAAVAGNGAADQFQLDAFGEALVLFAAAAEHDRADPAAARAAAVAADVIARRWPLPDAGIWETHDDLWAHSRLICAAGLRRAARVLASGPAQAREWTSLADALIAETSRTSLTPDGRWRRAPGDDRVDAALLIPPLRGALPPGDPRTAATLDAVRDHLVQEGFVYRYAVNDEPLGTAEGAFTLCGFFLALAEHRQGDAGRARATFERTRSGCATSGLFSEEYDVRQRQLRGNIPQAFVHALLLESAAGLARDPGRPPPSPPGE